jgi:hypothetical protein
MKEDKKIITLTEDVFNIKTITTKQKQSNKKQSKQIKQINQTNQINKKEAIQETHPINENQYITFNNIRNIYTIINAYLCVNKDYSIYYKDNIYNISNKTFMNIVRKNKINIDSHLCHHFLNFCRHVSYKLSGYKNQDRVKLKGDYKMNVVKTSKHKLVKSNNISAIENTTNQKSIVTDSYNYNDVSLYKHEYFNIYSFFKLFVDSQGKCFYCNKCFNLVLTKKYSECEHSQCFFYREHKNNIDDDCNGDDNDGNNENYGVVNNVSDFNGVKKQSIHDKSKRLQWSLERINNTIGHYQSNCVLACLECNLKRRTKNHEYFKFTKSTTFKKVNV